MSNADRWAGMGAGRCECGVELMWTEKDGVWAVVHADIRADASCATAPEAAVTAQ